MTVNWNTKIKPWGTSSSDTLFQMNLLYFKFIKAVEITSSTQFQVATKSTSSDLTTVFQVWSYGRFIQREREIQSNLRRKKRHRMNQGSNFLGGTFSSRNYVRAPIQFRRESHISILRDDFPSRTDPSIFTSIATKLVDFFQHWYQQATSCPSPQCPIDQIQV